MNKINMNRIICAGENYVEIGIGLFPSTRHQYFIESDEEFEELKKYLDDKFIKCF